MLLFREPITTPVRLTLLDWKFDNAADALPDEFLAEGTAFTPAATENTADPWGTNSTFPQQTSSDVVPDLGHLSGYPSFHNLNEISPNNLHGYLCPTVDSDQRLGDLHQPNEVYQQAPIGLTAPYAFSEKIEISDARLLHSRDLFGSRHAPVESPLTLSSTHDVSAVPDDVFTNNFTDTIPLAGADAAEFRFESGCRPIGDTAAMNYSPE